MRHRVQKKRLGRKTDQRKALMRNMLTSLLVHKKLTTTRTKAKAIKAAFDELVMTTVRQKEQREQIRVAKQTLFGEEAQRALLTEVLPLTKDRSSGFLRTAHLGPRKGDAAERTLLEIIL